MGARRSRTGAGGGVVRDLTKKRLGEFGKELEAMQAAFRTNVEKLAEEARTQILPYFKKHGLGFMAGNGDWIIPDRAPTRLRTTGPRIISTTTSCPRTSGIC